MIYAILAILIFTPLQAGRISQYAPGVMERVIKYRQSWGQIPQDLSRYDGFIAVLECSDIGQEFMLKQDDQADWELFLAVDCASKSDHQSDTDLRSGWQWMRGNNILAEVGYPTAERWGTERRMTTGQMVRVSSNLHRAAFIDCHSNTHKEDNMTLYCPKCGSTEVQETGHMTAIVERLHGKVTLIDYLDGFDLENYECQTCGFFSGDDKDADWTLTPSERAENELHDWADMVNDERKLQ